MAWHKIDPLSKLFIGLILLLFMIVAVLTQLLSNERASLDGIQDTQAAIQKQQKGGEERSYILRAIAGCADIINDGEIEIVTECTDERITAYYPPSICSKLPITVENCGSKATVVKL